MASKNQISQWSQQQQSHGTQKELANQLKLEGATMMKDIYLAILHIKDYCTKLEQAINISRKDNETETDIKIVLREDCKPLNYFCQCVERVLLFGYKKKFFRSSSVWSFIYDSTNKCFPLSQQLQTDINLIKSIEVLNDDGKTRAFLRQCLRSKLLPFYFKLILQQTEVIQDYYWDFGVISQSNQGKALLAQLDEFNYLPKNVEFRMLLSDKSLNIIENFKIDDYGVPQWHIKQEKGDIAMMTDIWLLKNRDNIGIDINVKKVKKSKKKKVKSKPKRKLNTLLSTDDLRSNNDNDDNDMNLQIIKDKISVVNHIRSDGDSITVTETKSKKKKKKKKREKDRDKRKKKKKDRDKRKKKKHKSNSQSLLYKHTQNNGATVIDDSEYIQNILEKEKLQNQSKIAQKPTEIKQSKTVPKSPGAFLRITPKSSPKILHINNTNNNDMNALNIDDIITEHFEKEQKRDETQILQTQKSVHSSPKQTQSKSKRNNGEMWYKRRRSSSVGNSVEYNYKRSKSNIKPNNFIKGTTAAKRPYEIIVIHRRKNTKNSGIKSGYHTPPPQRHSERHKQKRNNRRYLRVNKSTNISQSSSPTISVEHKIIRNKNPQNYKSHRHKSHLEYSEQNNSDSDSEDESDYNYTKNDMNKLKNTLGLISGNKRTKPRSNSSIIQCPKVENNEINTIAPDLVPENDQSNIKYPKPKLSKQAKEFIEKCESNDSENKSEIAENVENSVTKAEKTENKSEITEKDQNSAEISENPEIKNKSEIVENVENCAENDENSTEKVTTVETIKEISQNREIDEYDTDEDTQPQRMYNYQPFGGNIYLAASEPAQYLDQYLPSALTQIKSEPITESVTNEINTDGTDTDFHKNSYDSGAVEAEVDDNESEEMKRMRLRKERDEALRKSAMELDKRLSKTMPTDGLMWKPPNSTRPTSVSTYVLDGDSDSDSIKYVKRTQSSAGIYDIMENEEKQSNLSSILSQQKRDNKNESHNLENGAIESDDEGTHENDAFFESPIPKEQKDRFSRFMTDQFVKKKRAESEDLTGIFINHESPNYWTSPYNRVNASKFEDSPENSNEYSVTQTYNKSIMESLQNKRIPTAIFAHSELKSEGGSAVREQIKREDWHSGIEISWRTTPLPPRDNNALLLEQNFHCATCGLVLKSNFLRRAKYHYCRYLGLIHCNECHKNERAVIPHRVLHELDCKPATVCCAAKTYLDQMYNIPCITLAQFGQSEVVQSSRKIAQLTKILFELGEIKKYLDVCRDRNELVNNLYKEYRHWLRHADSLSLHDCVNIVSFNTGDKLQILSNKLQKHIMLDCDMCRGKGSYCEICNSQKVIYLFQFRQVEQCNVCKAAFHCECWQSAMGQCPRCKRRRKVAPPPQIK